MRRAVRWLWNSVTIVSLLLLAAVTVLWVRSDTVIDGWYWDGGHGTYDLRAVRSGFGEVQYANERGGYPFLLVPFRPGFVSNPPRSSGSLGFPSPGPGRTGYWGPVRTEQI